MYSRIAYDVGTPEEAGSVEVRSKSTRRAKETPMGGYHCGKCSVGDDVRVNKLQASTPFPFDRTKHQSGEGTLNCEKHELTPRCFAGDVLGVCAPRMQN